MFIRALRQGIPDLDWVEDWARWDQFGMMQQLGVIPESSGV